MKKFKKFLMERLEDTGDPTPPIIKPARNIVPPGSIEGPKHIIPTRLDPKYDWGAEESETQYTESELYDIIEEIIRQLNANCPSSSPCVTDEEIIRIREALRRIARSIASGHYGNSPDRGIGRIWKELKQLLSGTDLWYDLFHSNDGIRPNPSKFFDEQP